MTRCGKQTRADLPSAGQVTAGLQGLQGADEQAIETFYQANLGLIYSFVNHKVRNREEAEDVTSHIFLKAVHGIETARSPLSMQKWLFQVARTTIADHWRVQYRVPTLSLDELLETGWERSGRIRAVGD